MTSAHRSATLSETIFLVYLGGKLWDHIGQFGADLDAHPTSISKSEPGD